MRRVVTPRATLAGTAFGSSQKFTCKGSSIMIMINWGIHDQLIMVMIMGLTIGRLKFVDFDFIYDSLLTADIIL